MPFARLAAPLQQVFFPAFSRISDDRERMADIWIRATRLVGAFSIPALVGLVDRRAGVRPGRARPEVERTRPTVIRILAVVGIVQSLHTLNGEVLMALGKAGTLLRYTALWTVGDAHGGRDRPAVGPRRRRGLPTRSRSLIVEPLRAWVDDARARDPVPAARRARSRASSRRRRVMARSAARRPRAADLGGSAGVGCGSSCSSCSAAPCYVARLPLARAGGDARADERDRPTAQRGRRPRRAARRRPPSTDFRIVQAESAALADRLGRGTANAGPTGVGDEAALPPTIQACSTKLHTTRNERACARSPRASSRCCR